MFLTRIDTQHYKDRLTGAIGAKLSRVDRATRQALPDVPQWALNAANDADYNRQMTSEHKGLIRKADGRQAELWTPISGGVANH